MNDETPGLSFDSQLAAIQHVERRQLLLALLTATSSGSALDDGRARPGTDVRKLKLQMYHVHLPKLERMGLIEPNGNWYDIRRGPHFDDIVPLLRVIDDHEKRLTGDVL
ncbi:hypothetical protein [Haloferax massiliensis]|uniref:Helix-turn-helix domain protein n=1 Tax=Haloferax massiliensis TaxID=1476858 RepID=A0A0D6JMD9_9EURY|nr:hypothetical protein [Haloferax massiliensis]CQR49056.1 hypothetical protein BN996_00511 [Haloferax massiliensis]